MATELSEAARYDFHRHLDACAQCRGNPISLCKEGSALLRTAAQEAADTVLLLSKVQMAMEMMTNVRPRG
mgnify:CR=1 FL=1